MRWIIYVAVLMSAALSLSAEEDSTSPPHGYNSQQQGGSRLYPSLTGVSDYNNNRNANYGQPGNNYNSGSQYPYQQPGSNQPYPIGTGPYNMSYSGYPSGVNNANYNNRYNSSLPNYPNHNNLPGQNNYGTNPHRPFGTPGGTVKNPYQNHQNATRPYNPAYPNSRQPAYPTNPTYPNNPTYPINPTYPNNPAYPTNPTYPNNPRYPNNPSYPNYPAGNQGYRNNGTSYPRQPATNSNPHRPFGQPPRGGATQPNYNPYYKH